jgi:hypothetical protein
MHKKAVSHWHRLATIPCLSSCDISPTLHDTSRPIYPFWRVDITSQFQVLVDTLYALAHRFLPTIRTERKVSYNLN